MNKLSTNYLKINLYKLIFIFILIFSKTVLSSNIKFEIQGNNYTDTEAILFLLKDIPENIDIENTNDIIKVLNQSNLFSDVKVKFDNNKYIIIVKEFPNINKLYFDKNERLKDEDLKLLAADLDFVNYNSASINSYIDEVKKIYESFGYNNVTIEYSKKLYQDTNTIDLFFDINEGSITKINQIILNGNNNISAQEILQTINSKTKSIRNIFANNNFKPSIVEKDKYLISDYYKNNGFLDISVNTKIEYLQSNKVNIYFNIIEGKVYSLSAINITDENNILSTDILDLINLNKEKFLLTENIFSIEKIKNFKTDISSIIIDSGIEFFEINYSDKIIDNNIDVLFEILPIDPKYTNQINIVGNSRTFDYVIRRELNIVEGDAVHT